MRRQATPIRDFAIQNLHATGMSYKKIAAKFGMSTPRVTYIVKRPAVLTLEQKLRRNKAAAERWVGHGQANR